MPKQGFKVLDSDMHVMEPPDLWQRYITPEFRAIAPRGRTSDNVRDLGVIFPDGEPNGRRTSGVPHRGHNYERNQELYRDHARRGWGPDVQLEAMDIEGIDVAVLFPSRGLSVLTHPDREPRFAAAIARAYNDWMFDFCQTDTARLLGAGMISVYDIGDAVEETRRVVEKLKFRAVFIRSNIVNGKSWHDPYYEPLWDALEGLDIPVGFHEATGSRARQSGDHFEPNFGLRRIYAQPFEQMLGLGSFIGGGILARHPKLKVAFLEANCSWVPWLLWRMDEGYEREGDVFMPGLAMKPSDYFKRQCYVSVEPDEAPARYLIEELGSDRIVFSTDYPHGDARYPQAVECFLKLPLADEDKRKILWDNCARFYAIEEAPRPAQRSIHEKGGPSDGSQDSKRA
ncbi:MAG TPA: amidohydrolase family protein [Candidatus Binatia bacterium]|jgi:predicted TIM-barrel fold metal-dependent hydrolase